MSGGLDRRLLLKAVAGFAASASVLAASKAKGETPNNPEVPGPSEAEVAEIIKHAVYAHEVPPDQIVQDMKETVASIEARLHDAPLNERGEPSARIRLAGVNLSFTRFQARPDYPYVYIAGRIDGKTDMGLNIVFKNESPELLSVWIKMLDPESELIGIRLDFRGAREIFSVLASTSMWKFLGEPPANDSISIGSRGGQRLKEILMSDAILNGPQGATLRKILAGIMSKFRFET